MNPEDPDNEEELVQKAAAQEEEAKRRNREALRSVMDEMGVKRSPEEMKEIYHASEEADSDPLGALEDMTDVKELGITDEVLEAAGLSKEDLEEKKPLRRTGEGPAVDFAEEREVHLPGTRDEDDPWSRIVPGLGKVTATEEHREIYEENFFSNEPISLPIRFSVGKANPKPVEIICRTLTPYEREISALAVKYVVDRHQMLTAHAEGVVNEYALRAQMLMVIQRVQNEAWPAYRFEQKKGVWAQHDDAVEKLGKEIHEFFGSRQNRHFQMLAKAVHRFSVICDILDDAEINGDFTDPASFD